ncbi:MAG: MFS transporter, partial [Rhodospirillales bacterium]|nr:MFS transporter [Acetobacter sp.]
MHDQPFSSDAPPARVRPARQAALTFIFITVALDTLALGIIIPVLTPLVLGMVGGSEQLAAWYIFVFNTSWAAMQFFAGPLLGALSDRFGRRPVVLLSNFGLGLDYLVMALAPTPAWLFLGRVVSGFTAGSIPTAYAYIADVTPPEKRAASFGVVGGAFAAGFILGPALG